MEEKERVRIGCSGYYYSDWKNSFYPEKTPSNGMLKYYCTVFNTVELNSSFYNVPRVENMQTQAKSTPDNFDFAVKVNRYITHVHKLRDCKAQIRDFIKLVKKGLGSKLSTLLFQFPPSFKYSSDNLQLIESEIPDGAQNVIEFRHTTWWNEDVRSKLKEKGLTFCNVDFPKMPTEIRNDSDLFYLRLHGKPKAFQSPYGNKRLHYFLEQVPSKGPAYIYFNNTAVAWKNAITMLKMQEELTHSLSPHH